MFIVVGFALFVAALVILLLKARKLRWAWSLAALLVLSALMFAAYARTAQKQSAETRKPLADSCSFLVSQIHSLAFDFQSDVVAKQKGRQSPVDVFRLRDQYSVLVKEHRDWLNACIPNASHCLPDDLNENDVDKIERVTSNINDTSRCQ